MGTVVLEGNLKKERFMYPGKPPHLQGDLYRKCASEAQRRAQPLVCGRQNSERPI